MSDTEKRLQKLVDKFDLKSEAINAHEFVITHRALAFLMVKAIGAKATLDVFEVLDKESKGYGLPGLTGVCGAGPAKEYLERIGVSTKWDEWSF